MAYDGSRPITAADIRESFRNQPPTPNPIADALADAVLALLEREGLVTAEEIAELKAIRAEQGEKT